MTNVKITARRVSILTLATTIIGLTGPARADSPKPPQVPANVQGKDGVKTYLVTVVEACSKAAADFKNRRRRLRQARAGRRLGDRRRSSQAGRSGRGY